MRMRLHGMPGLDTILSLQHIDFFGIRVFHPWSPRSGFGCACNGFDLLNTLFKCKLRR